MPAETAPAQPVHPSAVTSQDDTARYERLLRAERRLMLLTLSVVFARRGHPKPD